MKAEDINILVACEESQAVTIEFRKRGFNAFSNDIQYCSGNKPEFHIMGDSIKIINGGEFFTQNGNIVFIDKWHMIIAHPPCTFLSNAAARWLYAGGKGEVNKCRFDKGLKAKDFFMKILNSKIEKIAIENPIPSKVYELPKATQSIQPFEFGHEFSKKTFLWLKNLPPLNPTDVMEKHVPFMPSNTGGKKRNQKATFVYRTQKQRSKTFPGIAKAMATQWGEFLLNELKCK